MKCPRRGTRLRFVAVVDGQPVLNRIEQKLNVRRSRLLATLVQTLTAKLSGMLLKDLTAETDASES